MENMMFVFKARLIYKNDNQLNISDNVVPNSSISLWYNESNFTIAEITKINNQSKSIKPGEHAIIVIKVINSGVSRQIKLNDVLFWGIPHKSLGHIEIIKRLKDIKFTVNENPTLKKIF